LLVAVILSVLGLSVYSVFNNGIKVWKKIFGNVIEEDVSLFFEKISRDLRNSFEYTGIKFEGSNERIAFPTLIVPKESKDAKYEIGYVVYFKDTIDKSINRKQQNYNQLYKNTDPIPAKVLSNIKNLTFQYYRYDPEGDKTSWESYWKDEENPPLAVRVKVEFYENNREKSFVKSIFIPVYKVSTESKEK
ncbi:MAG: hypothetical protein PHW62_03330, partial [Candidatus Ratteibacteria bacterium]|nr:hypothetical protein [Candidatus Ratteibacteria bacterium]